MIAGHIKGVHFTPGSTREVYFMSGQHKSGLFRILKHEKGPTRQRGGTSRVVAGLLAPLLALGWGRVSAQLTDEQLMDSVQVHALKYFWD